MIYPNKTLALVTIGRQKFNRYLNYTKYIKPTFIVNYNPQRIPFDVINRPKETVLFHLLQQSHPRYITISKKRMV